MAVSGRGANFRQVNSGTEHQRLAGMASFVSFSAHWRAWQGLSLLHPADVVYLTPADFNGPSGKPLSLARQRKVFRDYVEAASGLEVPPLRLAILSALRGCVPAQSYQGGDLAFIRLADRWSRSGPRAEVEYGRRDIRWYEPRALSPTRPYTVPVVSPAFQGYWLEAAPDPEQDDMSVYE